MLKETSWQCPFLFWADLSENEWLLLFGFSTAKDHYHSGKQLKDHRNELVFRAWECLTDCGKSDWVGWCALGGEGEGVVGCATS